MKRVQLSFRFMELGFDPSITVSWGYYSCENCNSRFYGERNPVHLNGCLGEGNVVYFFGRKEACNVLNDGGSIYSSLKVADLESNFPDLIAELRSDSLDRKR